MSKVYLYTSFTYAYLSRARVLAQSVRKRHPDWLLCAFIVDKPPVGFDDKSWEHEFDLIIDASILFPGLWHRWLFKHDIVEACTAVKGHAALYLMSIGAEKVIYLDPDIAVFHDLTNIVNSLDNWSVIITPHQIEPNVMENEINDNELISMKYGTYNLGFLAVRNDADGRKMVKWWASRLFHACYDDVSNGIFTDQKYIDLVPGLFSNVKIERDPGCNVASWNLSRRDIEILESGNIRVNDSLLRFYHFTKINSDGDSMTDRYAENNLHIFEIWNWYKRALKRMELPGIPIRYWHYHCFDNGIVIPKAARLLYRLRPELMSCFPEPFASGKGSYQEWFTLNGSEPDEGIKALVASDRTQPYISMMDSDVVAVVVHAFYPDLFPEICDLLSAYVRSLKLFVTTTQDKVPAVAGAMVGFPHEFEIIVCENRGRDVYPFLQVLPKIISEGHKFVLKLHTKRSKHLRDGKRWRRELLTSLADPHELSWAIDTMQKRPDIGIVGPLNHVLNMSSYWGSNEAAVRLLADRMGVGHITPDPNVFVAGTMFLARLEALVALSSLSISECEFEPEMGQTDGTLAHAIERALTYSAAAAGLRVAAKPTLAAGTLEDFVLANSSDYRFAPRSDV